MSLNDEIYAIVSAPRLKYDVKLSELQKLMTKAEAMLLLGENPKEQITLRDPLGGLPPLYLVIEKTPFDEIMSGMKKEEYRFLSDGNMNRLTYHHEGRRYLKPYDRIRLCVGYHKNRDEAIVEVTGIETDGFLVTYKLGRILERRKKQ
ncbi:MAG: hypothetical protein ACI3YI_13220 [Bacteroidaceae bacterium]